MTNSRVIAWSVWLVASVFYAYQYVLRVLPNIMLTDIMQQFHINAAIFGQFSGVYYIGYSLVHIPIGIMLDRYGPKRIMTECILLTVIGLLPILFSTHWVYPIVGRALIGIGSSAAILGTFKIIRMTFSEQRFTRMLSFSVTIGLIGAIYGGGPINYFDNLLGYQAVVKILALLGLLLAAVTYIIVPHQTKQEKSSVLADIKEVLGTSKVIWSCIFAGLMVGPLEGFADVWGTAFLKQVYHLNGSVAASLPSLIFIGMCFGGPVLSLIAEKTGNYLATVIGAGILMALSFFGLITGQLPATLISICFVLVGICCAYQIIAIYNASTYVPPRVAGLTTAVANMIIMSFGYALHTLISTTINFMGGPNVTKAFIYGVAVIPILVSIGIIGFITILWQERTYIKGLTASFN